MVLVLHFLHKYVDKLEKFGYAMQKSISFARVRGAYIMKKFLAILLMAAMLCMNLPAMADVFALAGTYELDAAPLGMPLKVYIIIHEDGTFQMSNKPVDGADKGNGTIGEKDGTYVMLYSDSTNEKVKSATFTLDGKSLVFSTAVPYGSASFSPNADENIYPVALLMAYDEYLGEYAGTLVADTAMGEVVYETEMKLEKGAKATFSSSFTVMGTSMTYVQEGTFDVKDGAFTMTTAEGNAITGTVNADGSITVSAALSQMSSTPREVTLVPATTAEYAGEYAAVKDFSMMGFNVTANLSLSKVGTYHYVSSIEEGTEDDYVEDGTYAVENGVITLTPAEGEATVGAYAAAVATLKLKITSSVSMATELVFYGDKVQGVYTAEGEDEIGNTYFSTLTLNPDGTYAIMLDANGMPAYDEVGTFRTEESMNGISIVLVDATGVESAGVVSDTLNITHNVDYSFNTLGFQYEKGE